MANTTSGTATFDKTFAIDEIIEEAYERIGMQGVSGNQLRMARRSLNIMFQECGNRGLHYWEVANNSITLVADQATYTMFRSTGDGTSSTTAVYGVDDVLEASFRNSNVDTPLTKIARSAYQALSNKTATGVPSQYFVQRLIDRVTITLQSGGVTQFLVSCPAGDVFAFNIPEDGVLFPGGMKVSTITNLAGATFLIDK